MLKTKLVKGVLAVSAVAALFAALAVQAQTGATNTQSTTGATTATGTGGATGRPTGSQAGATTGAGKTDAQTGMHSGTMGGPALSRADQKMLKDMAMSNLAEIEAARMAQGKTQSEQVKNFAQQMIDDHTKALGEVQQLAQTKGVSLPTELDRTHKRKAERLGALSGDACDQAYMNQAGLADHKATHALLQRTQAKAKDPDLKALAARTIPIVDQHLNSANQLNNDTARGSSRTQGTTGASPDKR